MGCTSLCILPINILLFAFQLATCSSRVFRIFLSLSLLSPRVSLLSGTNFFFTSLYLHSLASSLCFRFLSALCNVLLDLCCLLLRRCFVFLLRVLVNRLLDLRFLRLLYAEFLDFYIGILSDLYFKVCGAACFSVILQHFTILFSSSLQILLYFHDCVKVF